MSNSAHGSSSAQATTGARPQFGDLWNEFACASGAGLAILDEQLRYVAVNDPLAQMNGIPAAAHIGNSIHDLLGESARELEPALRRVLGEGRPVLNYDWNARLRGRDHAGSWLEHYIPLHDEQGRVKWIGAIVISVERPKAGASVSEPQGEAEFQRTRREALLIFNKLGVSRGLHEFFAELPQTMRQLILHDFGLLVFADSHSNTFGAFGLGIDIGTDLLMREESRAVLELFALSRPHDTIRVLTGRELSSPGPKLFACLLQNRVEQACCIALESDGRRVGTLILCRTSDDNFDKLDTELARQLGAGMVLAMDNLLANKALRSEKAKLRLLHGVNSTLGKSKEFLKLAPAIARLVRDVIPYDSATLVMLDQKSKLVNVYPLDWLTPEPEFQMFPATEQLAAMLFGERETRVFSQPELKGNSSYLQHLVDQGTRSLCCVPLAIGKGPLAVLNFASNEDHAFSEESLDLLQQLAAQVALVVNNNAARKEIEELKQKLGSEKLLPIDEVRDDKLFDAIVGHSVSLRQVLARVKIVAPSDATVLILGETGTGKDQIARAIHRASSRKDSVFAKLNCAAIPTGLFESELFGHEKGAFTGAITQKVGRLELADRGTLFLDEVGDIPLELQPKLLRVLQDQEFERLGGTRTIRVDVRLIAATNRDLEQAKDEQKFRSDLFYRLNVFPIRVPPLRDRKEDISRLVHYFVQKFSCRMKKSIQTIPSGAMQAIQEWDWPGNVRELENFIERSVILTDTSTLTVTLSELENPKLSGSPLEALERDRIIRVLRETGGVIAGADGAAARLGLKRTTLQSKITRLGILLEDFRELKNPDGCRAGVPTERHKAAMKPASGSRVIS